MCVVTLLDISVETDVQCTSWLWYAVKTRFADLYCRNCTRERQIVVKSVRDKRVCRGGSRIFLRRGALLRNGVTGRRGNQILKGNTKKKASSQGAGGGCAPPEPPLLDPPLVYRGEQLKVPKMTFYCCALFISELTSRRDSRTDMVSASLQRGEYCGQIFIGK